MEFDLVAAEIFGVFSEIFGVFSKIFGVIFGVFSEIFAVFSEIFGVIFGVFSEIFGVFFGDFRRSLKRFFGVFVVRSCVCLFVRSFVRPSSSVVVS